MNEYLSKKLSILSLISILGVIIIHTYYLEAEAYHNAAFVQNFIGRCMRFCVPLFFMISGYLFFYNIKENPFSNIFKKIKKRGKTILIPYIIYNLLFFLSIVILQIIPYSSNYINTDYINILKTGYISSIFIFIFWEPAAFHLWFLKYLIFYLLSTPFLFYIYRYKILAYCSLFIFFIVGIFYFQSSHIQSYIYFALGAFGAIHNININTPISKKVVVISLFIYLSSILIINIYPELNLPHFNIPLVFIACFIIWGGYDIVAHYLRKDYILKLTHFTFFVYLFHEPWLNLYKKLALKIFGINEVTLIIAYITIPFIMYFTLIGVAILTKKLIPKTYSLLTGGRI